MREKEWHDAIGVSCTRCRLDEPTGRMIMTMGKQAGVAQAMIAAT